MNDGRIKTLLIKRRKDGVQVFLHDGKEGYSFVDGRRRDDAGASGEAYYRANGEYYLRALPFKWKDSGVQATYDGETVFEAGRPSSSSCRRLPARASPRRTCGARSSIKRATCCSKRASSTTRSMQTWMNPPQTGVNEIRYRYSDCRPVGRLRLPFRMEYWSSGCRTGENLVQTYELDVAVDPKLFRPETHLTAKR